MPMSDRDERSNKFAYGKVMPSSLLQNIFYHHDGVGVFFAGGHKHFICFVAITHKNMVIGINDKHIYEI